MFVEVVFNLAINRLFTYRVPEEIEDRPQSGQRVRAPFGTRELAGIIVSVSSSSTFSEPRYIHDILDEKPVVTQELLDLTRWISEYYMSSWGQSIQLALPRNLSGRQKRDVFINAETTGQAAFLPERQRFLFDIIARDDGRPVSFYKEKFGYGAFEYILRQLQTKNLIHIHDRMPHLKQSLAVEKYISILKPVRGDFSGLKDQEKLKAVLEQYSGRTIRWHEFVQQTGLTNHRIHRLADRDIVHISEKEIDRSPTYSYHEEKKEIRLNSAQLAVLEQVTSAISESVFRSFLLHGITGSGKTEIYIAAIQHTLKKGKTAILLIPEISLTPQTVSRFELRFPGQVVVFHSRMTDSERFYSWYRVFNEQKKIVIGPRSALFMPVRNLGIIVVDEEHDGSYKQSSNVPRYNARDAAVYRARLNHAVVILGSATPALESYHNTYLKKYTLLELPSRIKESRLPNVEIVDTTSLHRSPKQSAILSPVLYEKIRDRLLRHEQIILLQNRRGYASFLQCIDCGYLHICPNCEITLTYHAHNRMLRCHYCDYSTSATDACPRCSGDQINYRGVGTQKVEAELNRLFPQARILRMDQDTTRGKDAHDKILALFREQQADILLGTQMIAKGLDFHSVTLVGVIAAEIGLTLPDYRSAERTFQLLTQVAGRSGRGPTHGEVVIQSTMSSHYALQFARLHDYAGFYEQEILFRREMDYPPFSRLINIRLSGPDLQQIIGHAGKVAHDLRRLGARYFRVTGPAPAPFPKIGGMFRWHILLKISNRNDTSVKKSKEIMTSSLERFLKKKSKEIQLVVDVDPLEIM